MPKTTIEVLYPRKQGKVALRGNLPPLSWTKSLAPTRIDGRRELFEFELPDNELLEFKAIRNEKDWSSERNYTVASGQSAVVQPYFDRARGEMDPQPGRLHSKELKREIVFSVFLPPSYEEHHEKHYPVLYAQDGHALFSTQGEEGSWGMDVTLNQLYELGALEEIIVVGVHTEVGRMEMLSPSPDPEHGGGDGPGYLAFLVESLKPLIDQRYRTLPERQETGLMGSSMGGLFSFFAAWTRSDVFGKAACLSSSFWWNQRSMVAEVLKGLCPVPRPLLYIDSGAAVSPFEEDANLRDGFHHSVAMRNALVNHCYTPGVNIQMLAFAGLSHDNASWGARLAIPLQFLFPRKT